jgi:hypothetical protein
VAKPVWLQTGEGQVKRLHPKQCDELRFGEAAQGRLDSDGMGKCLAQAVSKPHQELWSCVTKRIAGKQANCQGRHPAERGEDGGMTQEKDVSTWQVDGSICASR